jgi:hypothetical protein
MIILRATWSALLFIGHTMNAISVPVAQAMVWLSNIVVNFVAQTMKSIEQTVFGKEK